MNYVLQQHFKRFIYENSITFTLFFFSKKMSNTLVTNQNVADK